MLFTLIIAVVFGGIYCALIIFFTKGWKRTPYFISAEEKHNFTDKISVVVACRNEEKHLPTLLSHLHQQTNQQFELIIVNDHSTDKTSAILSDEKGNFANIKIINAVGFGKKNALYEGILAATSDFIICTDADCMPHRQWLETITTFQSKQNCDLIICPVNLFDDERFFTRLQIVDFIGLISSGAGAAGMKRPILCNGANLAFKKKIWLNSRKYLHADELSGDDVFLLESALKLGSNVQFLKAKEAMVSTFAAENVKQFFNQRRRWASKSPAYSNKLLIATACIVFGVSLVQVCLFVFALIMPFYWLLFGSLFLLKLLSDITLLHSTQTFFDLKHIIGYSFALSIVYPFYIVFTALFALLFKPQKWK